MRAPISDFTLSADDMAASDVITLEGFGREIPEA